jgi:hypothetical protein
MIRPILAALLCAITLGSEPQDMDRSATAPLPKSVAVPFRAGETFDYDASFGFIRVARGRIQLSGFDTVRSRIAWRATMTINGGPPLYRVKDSTISWFDVRTGSSLRYMQHLSEGGYKADRLFEIYPDRAVYVRNGKSESPSVSEPLDDNSFLFFLRTVPLEVGRVYQFNRYFQPEGNPVEIRVLRKERVNVPAGTFNTVVVQPLISSPGLFSKKERPEVWITDDSLRILVQIKSHVKFGSLRLALRKYTPGVGGPN